LTLNIFRAAGRSDCTNGGISSKGQFLTLIGEDLINGGTISGPFEADDDAPAVCLGFVQIGDKRHYHLQPANPYTGEPLPGWYMSGGNIAYSSDGRFPSDYPLKVHDRTES
jgi:hypothetical protein